MYIHWVIRGSNYWVLREDTPEWWTLGWQGILQDLRYMETGRHKMIYLGRNKEERKEDQTRCFHICVQTHFISIIHFAKERTKIQSSWGHERLIWPRSHSKWRTWNFNSYSPSCMFDFLSNVKVLFLIEHLVQKRKCARAGRSIVHPKV